MICFVNWCLCMQYLPDWEVLPSFGFSATQAPRPPLHRLPTISSSMFQKGCGVHRARIPLCWSQGFEDVVEDRTTLALIATTGV